MKILNFIKLFMSLGLVFLLNSTGYTQDYPAMTIKFGDLLNRNFGYYQGIVAFKTEIEKRSAGKIKVEIITDNKMGTPKDALESLQLGAVQMGVNTPAYTQGSVKEHMIWAMPYLFKDKDTWQKFAYGPMGKELGDKIEPFGIKFLSWCSAGGRGFLAKKPLATPADFSGLKIRSIPDPVVVEIIKSFTAQPVVMNIQEVYTSLQQGVLDGSELSIELVTAFKFNEVAKYYTETAHNGTPGMVLTNLAWWNKQPKIVQDLIEDVVQKNYRKTNDEFYANVDPFSTQQQQTLAAKVLTEKGVTMVKPDIVAFKKASSPVIDQFKAKIGKDYVESVLKAVGY
jgi:tripartite ATP-independent transporter DctP family solute receptor